MKKIVLIMAAFSTFAFGAEAVKPAEPVKADAKVVEKEKAKAGIKKAKAPKAKAPAAK